MTSTNLVSTTDSKEDVTKALGMYNKENKPVDQTSAQAAPHETVAPASETPEDSEPSEAETPAAQAEGEGETDAQNGSTDEQKAAKKKGGFQRRIDKVTKERTQAQAERDHYRKLYEEQIAKGVNAGGAKPAAAEPPAQAQADGQPDPEKFDTVAKYMSALAAWEYKQQKKADEIAKKAAEAEASVNAINKAFGDRVREFSSKTPDWHDVAADFDEKYPQGFSAQLMDAIKDSDVGAQIMYDLAKDHAKFEKISTMSPMAMAREIGRLEAKHQSSGASGTQTQTRTTSAPPPIRGVSRGSHVSTKDPGEMTMREYNAHRDAGWGKSS